MAAFVTRTMDQSLKRGSRRAALKQFWTPTSADGLGLTTVGSEPQLVESDGADLWVANNGSGTVSRVRASDGKLLETWTGATGPWRAGSKGTDIRDWEHKPRKALPNRPNPTGGCGHDADQFSWGKFPEGISFDGARIWTANLGGSVSIVTLNPLSVTTVTAGFTQPHWDSV